MHAVHNVINASTQSLTKTWKYGHVIMVLGDHFFFREISKNVSQTSTWPVTTFVSVSLFALRSLSSLKLCGVLMSWCFSARSTVLWRNVSLLSSVVFCSVLTEKGLWMLNSRPSLESVRRGQMSVHSNRLRPCWLYHWCSVEEERFVLRTCTMYMY